MQRQFIIMMALVAGIMNAEQDASKLVFSGAIGAMSGQDWGAISPSARGITAKLAKGYLAGTIGFGLFGQILQRYSGAYGAGISDKASITSTPNIVEYPTNFYSPSIKKYYASQLAHKSYIMSSLCSAPLRSAIGSILLPLDYAKRVMELLHESKDPKITNHYAYARQFQDLKQEAKINVLKAPHNAVLGFGVPYACVVAKQYAEFLQNKSE